MSACGSRRDSPQRLVHDLGNCLQVVQSCGEELRTQLPHEGDQWASVQVVLTVLLDAAGEGGTIVRQLLASPPRAASAGSSPAPRTTRMTDRITESIAPVLRVAPDAEACTRVDETIAALRPSLAQLASHDVALRLRCRVPWHAVPLRRQDLATVLGNLITNARDAMHADTRKRRIAIATSFDTHDPERPVRVTVRDTGPGIPAELLPRIFDVGVTTKGWHEGSGWGLAIVRDLVEQAGGLVSAGNAPEGGAEFVIRLPALTAEMRRGA